jgi:hypothetical protein
VQIVVGLSHLAAANLSSKLCAGLDDEGIRREMVRFAGERGLK